MATIRIIGALTAAIAVALSAACHRNRGEARGPEPTVPLVVRNDGVFDVTIYALPSAGTDVRIRVGLAIGASAVTIAIPRRGLQPSGALVLMLHAIGARGSWVSPSLVVPDAGTAYLEIYSDSAGDLSRSVFYALAPTATQDGALSEPLR